jgi:hypothetical protein
VRLGKDVKMGFEKYDGDFHVKLGKAVVVD